MVGGRQINSLHETIELCNPGSDSTSVFSFSLPQSCHSKAANHNVVYLALDCDPAMLAEPP